MIKINLATRKTSSVSTGTIGGGAASGLAGTGAIKIDAALLKDLPLRQFAVAILVCYAAQYALDTYEEGELAAVDAEIQKLTAQKAQLQAEADKMAGYEELRKSIEADQFTLRTKIETIQKLLDDRTTPPKLLMELSKALPAEVWLSELKVADREVSLRGASTSFQKISDFMKALDENVYMTGVKTQGTQEARDEMGAPIKQFEISAQRR